MQKIKRKKFLSMFLLLTPIAAVALLLFGYISTPIKQTPEYAVGINEQINFQGRLLTAAGAVVPDGTYNIRFKIYQDGDGVLGGGDETLKWTETRESGNKVLVKNGYFSVYLGSVDALTGIDWNQSVLWLSVDVGGTGSPSYDGEMTPFNRMGSTPYALNSKQLGGLTASQFIQLAPSVAQTDSGTNNSLYLNKTGSSGNIMQLQKNGVDVFNVANSGAIAATYSSSSTTGATESAHTITVADSGAVTSGTDDTRGLSIVTSHTGASGSATVFTFGINSTASGDTGGTSTTAGVAGTAAGADTNYGLLGIGLSVGTGQSEVIGVAGQTNSVGFTGTTASAYALQGIVDLGTNGTYTTAAGLMIKTATKSGGVGTITDNYGIYVQPQSAGAADYGIRVDAADTQTLWLSGNADNTNAEAGIAFGASKDTNLYRGAANQLKTDDSFNVVSTNSNALLIQSASAADTIFTADTAARSGSGGNRVKIGNSTGTDGDLTVLQLDATSADPTTNLAALNGGLFYDSGNNKVKIIENGVVKTLCNTTDAGCGAGGSTSLQSAYDNSSSPATILLADGKNFVINAADTTTDPSIIFNLQCTTSCNTNGRFAVQSGGTDVMRISPNGGAALFKNTSNSTTAFQIQSSGSTTSILNVDTTNGRVGIGTNAPGSKLDVQATSTTSTAGNEFAQNIAFTDTGAVSTGDENTYALNITVARTGGSSTANLVTSGINVVASGDTGGNSKVYGIAAVGYGADFNYGFYGGALNVSTTVSNTSVGVLGASNTFFGGGGTVTNAYGVQTAVGIDLGAFTYTTAAGLNVSSSTNTAGGTIVNNYGIKVETQTAGGSDYGIRVDTADTQTLWISGNADSTTANAGIAFGQTVATQANLYRGGANLLKTDSTFQVGGATNSADINVYGDITKKGVKKITGLANINDVFIYDTTRDSDAGAWTNSATSQSLSWYTEAKDDGPGDACVIATDDRCDGSRFPQKAVIVSTNDAVYIFDAIDFKLFMKFTQSGGTFALGADTNNNPSGVFALNGIVYVGTNGASGTGMYAIDFTSDRMFNYNTTDRDQGDKNIANRNTAVTYATDSRTSFAINNNIVNDVHGTVISGSASAIAAGSIPQHGTTFIVAATDSGASVINFSYNKVLDYGDNLTDDVNQVWLTRRGILYLTNETLAQLERYNTIDTDTADQNAPDDLIDETTTNLPNLAKTAPTMSTSPDALQVVEQSSLATEFNATTITSGDVVYIGHSQGLTEFHDVAAPAAAVFGWTKFYKTTGTTSLMSGTPRAMFGFNEASGDAIDDTIRANVLETKGTPTRQINGVHGLGARFNGTTDYFCSDTNNDATCDQDTDFDPGTNSFHVELWFKKSGTVTGTDTLIDHTYDTSNVLGAGFRIYMNSNGTISAGIDDDTATPVFDDDIITTATTQPYNDGQWHHLVFEKVSAALTNPGQAAGTYLYIDGRWAGSDGTLAATLTLTRANTVLAIGADCSVGANCSTGANFWEGDIDDVYISMGGTTTTVDALNASAGQVRRKSLEGKAAAGKPSTFITDATTATSTTLGKTAQNYVPNEFVGSIVEITGGTGAGQTRRIVSNDATTLTVSPAFSVTPDTTSDYEVIPEQLYGASDSVTSLGVTDSDFLGKSRTMFVGTNDGADGGGITAFQGYGTPSANSVFHANAGITDDSNAGWTGTDADDITSVEARGSLIMLGSLQGLWMQRDDRNIDQTLDQIINDLASIRQELTIDGLNGATSEFSNVGTGADLAERYTSLEDLKAGEVVSMEKNNIGAVKKTSLEYDPELLGIVATEPAIVIGPQAENSHPIALSGRVPVKVVVQPGQTIKAGDRITSSSLAGYGMKAVVAGRVIGTALDDLITDDKLAPCPSGAPTGAVCGVITVFVNLVDFNGQNIEVALEDFENGGLTLPDSILDPMAAWIDVQDESGIDRDKLEKSDKILRYLLARKQSINEKPQSEVLTDRLSAFDVNAVSIFAKDIVAGTLTVDTIRANKIEGLEILTDKVNALTKNTLTPVPETPSTTNQVITDTSINGVGGVTFEAITVKDLAVGGTLFANGALKVAGPVDFLGTSVFHKLATFVEKAVFKNDVEFNGRVAFNNDVGGFAIIHPGQSEVEVKFEKPYEKPPVINLTRKNGIFIDYAYKDLKPEGFKIVIEKPATEAIEFSWSALQIKDAKTTQVPLVNP